MIKILIIGPFPEPITGNSLSNNIVFEGFKARKGYKANRINTSLSFFDEKVGYFSFKKALEAFGFNLQLYKIFFSDIVYLTPGQTFFGVLKYSVLIFSAKFLKKKIIIHIHGNHLQKLYKEEQPLKKKMLRLVLARANEGIVLSESLLNNLTPFLPKSNIHIVYNFVEDFLVENTDQLISKKRVKPLKIIYLSNLMKEKGILDLLEALKMMSDDGVPYEAKIAGNIDIKFKDELDLYFSKLKNVEYLGVLNGQAKKELLLWGNVFVFPSYYIMEGQPISLLEAMATGNIILTTNHAGISDVFQEGINGHFINKKSSSDIVFKLKKIQQAPEEYHAMHYNNFKYAKENFSTEAFLNHLETIMN